MLEQVGNLPAGKGIYFASDFHLGVPDKEGSRTREAKIVRWLKGCQKDAAAIILAGDIFDFWFEYRRSIPKGFIRLQGKIAEITDSGIPVIFFTGNHDMWMFDYFPEELGVTIYRSPQVIQMNGKKLLVGHGDGLGPGDFNYKILKKIFSNRFCQWAFARVHPNLGIGLANYWSSKSRISNSEGVDDFDEKTDFLLNYCLSMEAKEHFDFYIFGHRHIPIKKKVGEESWYINLGEWVTSAHYARFDGLTVELIPYE
jgi:UDP-2,3-diacylglucosamine hydrolase